MQQLEPDLNQMVSREREGKGMRGREGGTGSLLWRGRWLARCGEGNEG